MKSGANFIEQNQIMRMFEQGESAQDISVIMGIKEAHVASYAPKKKVKKKAKAKE